MHWKRVVVAVIFRQRISRMESSDVTSPEPVNTWKEALRGALTRARDVYGLTQDAVASHIGKTRVALNRAAGTGSGLGWEAAVALADLVHLDGVARVDFLYAFLETKTSRQDEGYAFLKMTRKLVKKLPREEIPLFREQVVQAYEETLKERDRA